MSLEAIPVSWSEACRFIDSTHRHLKAPKGHKFSIGAAENGELVGVVTVGRPVNRNLDDGKQLEITRLATNGHRNACSFLYGRACKAAFAMGYSIIGTYIRADESGLSLKAAGFTAERLVKGRSWNCQSRPRAERHELIDRVWYVRRAA